MVSEVGGVAGLGGLRPRRRQHDLLARDPAARRLQTLSVQVRLGTVRVPGQVL